MKLAYADPPYPGNARRHYRDQVLCQEVNHTVLIGTLCASYDGWALSTGSVHLRELLPLCPAQVRVAAWVKPFAAMRKNVVPMAAWEPVIVSQPSRPRSFVAGSRATMGRPHDWHLEMPPIFKGEDRGIKGTKPMGFCLWVLDLLGYQPGDDLDDLFPGSGIMAQALQVYGRQRELFPVGLRQSLDCPSRSDASHKQDRKLL